MDFAGATGVSCALFGLIGHCFVPLPPPMSRPNSSNDNIAPSSSISDNRKQSLYFPEAMLEDIKAEAIRLDRSLSWVVQRAWKTARAEIRKIPSSQMVEDSPASVEP
jgi:uncharacterized small protein (TIGR04563 family)